MRAGIDNVTLGFPGVDVRNPGQERSVRQESFYAAPAQRRDLIFNFLEETTLNSPLVLREAGTAGTPVAEREASEADGGWSFTLVSNSEAEVVGCDFADYLPINPLARPYFEARVKISGKAAATRFIFGLGTAYNATFDSIAQHAWFRIEGDSLNLYCEADDGTTDSDDQDTGIDLVANTWVRLGIDLADPNAIKFLVNGEIVKELSAPALAATHLMQPLMEHQKDSGASVGSFNARLLRLSWDADTD